MSDVKVVMAAVAMWVGCAFPVAVPWWFGGLVVATAVVGNRANVFIGAALLLGFSLGSSADADYRPLPAQPFDGVVQILSLPDVRTFSERTEVRLPTGDRVYLSVPPGAGSIRSSRAGESWHVSGSIRPADGSRWDRSRHVVGTMSVRSVRRVGSGGLHWQVAAALQDIVERSAQTMPGRSEALYNGLVTGDDRGQGAGQRAIFRAVGLSHVLAVSGQNVAFVVLILHLVVGAVPRLIRPLLICLGLGLFALVTQLEPSVLRATVTAGIGYWAVVMGRHTSGARLLAIAVGCLLGIDPFLAWSLGFQLSVLASFGILVLAPALTSRMRGPVWLRVPMAITVSAQLLVSPLLILTFGPVSLMAVPANLLVGWAVGLVMVWGMSVGLVAGILGGPLGTVLLTPVRPLLWWIDAVARFASQAPPVAVGAATGSIAVAVLVSIAWLPKTGRRLAWVGVAVALVWFGQPARPLVQTLDGGGTVFGHGGPGTVVVLDANADDRVVESLVAAGVGSIELVVVKGTSRRLSVVVRELGSVRSIGTVIAPPQHAVVGAHRLQGDAVVRSAAGPLAVSVQSDRSLEVEVRIPGKR